MGRTRAPARRHGVPGRALFPHLTVAGTSGSATRHRSASPSAWSSSASPTAPVRIRTSCRAVSASASRSARALAPAPEVILLDEPFASLDAGLAPHVARAGARDPARGRRKRAARDPRPAGGAVARRRGRGDARRRVEQAGTARGGLPAARVASGWRSSSARPRCCRCRRRRHRRVRARGPGDRPWRATAPSTSSIRPDAVRLDVPRPGAVTARCDRVAPSSGTSR